MITLREAAQQALEFVTSEAWGTTPYMDVRVYEDAARLRDALQAALRAALAQEQAEPVASLMTHVQSGDVEVVWNDDGFDSELWHETPLYTAPPRCLNCASLEAQNTELDRKLAELERAHGIIESEIKKDSHQTLDDAMQQPRAMAQAYENGYKAGAAAERKRIIQFLNEMQRQVGDGHNYYGVAAMRIREMV